MLDGWAHYADVSSTTLYHLKKKIQTFLFLFMDLKKFCKNDVKKNSLH